MVTLINPYHLTKGESMARHRRNSIHRPRVRKGKGGIFASMHSKMFTPGKRLNPRRRHARHNPMHSMKIRNWVNKEKLMYLGGITGGLVGGVVLGMPLIDMAMKQTIDKSGQYRKFYGVGNILLGILMFSFLKNRLARTASTGVIVSGLYDLIAANTLSTLGLPILPTANPLTAKMLPASTTATMAQAPVSMDYLPMSAPTMVAMDYQSLGGDSFYSECLQ
jgi:hypothetical protein